MPAVIINPKSSTEEVHLNTLPYGTVVRYCDDTCLVCYHTPTERILVSLNDPKRTWTLNDRIFRGVDVLGVPRTIALSF